MTPSVPFYTACSQCIRPLQNQPCVPLSSLQTSLALVDIAVSALSMCRTMRCQCEPLSDQTTHRHNSMSSMESGSHLLLYAMKKTEPPSTVYSVASTAVKMAFSMPRAVRSVETGRPCNTVLGDVTATALAGDYGYPCKLHATIQCHYPLKSDSGILKQSRGRCCAQ